MSLVEKVEWLGQMYARGFAMFDNDVENGEIRSAVAEINKKIYDRSDSNINRIYDTGRAWSLEYFETLYEKLGTKFDKYIFESEAAPIGLKLIEENKNLFTLSDGALIYNGEAEGLHTRVFVNSNGLPTYETKDLGNMQIKLETFPNLDESVVITGNEQVEYFKVVYSVLAHINPKLKDKLKHHGHGMMRFADGKMSSRRGNIIAGDELINNLKEKLRIKFAESRVASENLELLLDKVAIAGIKYSILRQAIGKDIIFDMNKAISTDGDSGPYLQYTHARMYSLTKDVKSNLEDLEIDESNRDLVMQLIKLAKFDKVIICLYIIVTKLYKGF
jgi:arginyl-tRNA synthetase